MNAQARTSISRLIDDLSTPQDDDQTGGVVWKPTAAKLVDLELKYTSPPAAALSGTPAQTAPESRYHIVLIEVFLPFYHRQLSAVEL